VEKKDKLCRYLLDGAHNLDGVKNLAKTLSSCQGILAEGIFISFNP